MNWQKEAENRSEELIRELQELIQIESVLDEAQATDDAPFGPGPLKALQWLLRKGEEQGLTVRNIDNMAGHIEMGSGEESLGILCHVDVVPAGSGWKYPPFQGVVEDGKLFGRGAIDDKGPTMAAWLAMKMVKDAGIELNRRVRLIIGSDEESGFRCVTRYFEKEEMPTMGFAPDADFPIINAEKGIADLVISKRLHQDANEQGQLISFQSGQRTNMVPDFAEAQVRNVADDAEAQFTSFLHSNGLQGTVERVGDVLQFQLHGKSAHAMEPNDGVNAAVLLATFLDQLVSSSTSKEFTSFLKFAFNHDSRGHALGLAYTDDLSGDTTFNPGVIRFDCTRGAEIRISMRYSVSYPFDEKITAVQQRIAEKGFQLDVVSNSTPHFVDEKEELIQKLSKVYERHTGEEAKLLAIGGGTYARVLEKGVAFGMLFPGEEDIAHQADEYVKVDHLIKAAAIYADAIVELAGKTNGKGGN